MDGLILCQVKKCGFLTLPYYNSDDQRKDYRISSKNNQIIVSYIRDQKNDNSISWARKENFDGRIVIRKKIMNDLNISEGDYLRVLHSDDNRFVLEKTAAAN